MSTRTEALVEQFTHAHNDLVDIIQRTADDEWRKVPAGEQRTAGVVAYHTAQGYLATLAFVKTLARGQGLPPLTPELLQQANAQEATEHAGASKEEVLHLLEANCSEVVAGLSELSDAQLDVTGDFFGHQVTVEAVAAGVVLHHVREHTESIRSVLGR